jgi:hypothetical protein
MTECSGAKSPPSYLWYGSSVDQTAKAAKQQSPNFSCDRTWASSGSHGFLVARAFGASSAVKAGIDDGRRQNGAAALSPRRWLSHARNADSS